MTISGKREREMKKDIEWLKKEIPNLRGYAVLIDGEDGEWEPVTTVSVEDIYELINRLDELEVLSQEWIDEHRESTFDLDEDFETVFIKVEDLQNLIVPKQEVLSQEWIEKNTWVNDHIWRPFVYVDDLKEILVPKQGLPTIPEFVAEFLDGKEDYMLHELFDDEWLYNRHDQIAKWLYDNDEETNRERELSLALAHIYGYEVETEQRYYLKIGNLYLAEPLGDMTSDIVRMTRDKGVAYQFADEKSIATHLDKFEGTEAVKVEEMEAH